MSKKYSMKRNIRVNESTRFGEIGKNMYWEPEEFPSIDRLNCDFLPHINRYIDTNKQLIDYWQFKIGKHTSKINKNGKGRLE